ncbi:MAG: magnesium transporter CorA family protein [Roseiflexaceae bacterium]|nr:magnesium transporter CorA family protein [Roseiflexaceae bacterium]
MTKTPPLYRNPHLPAAPQAMQRQIEYGGLTWIDFTYPSREHVEYLRDQYGFHPLHLEDILSRIQRPKIDDNSDPNYLFLVLHFPVFNEMSRLSTVSEIDIFIGQDFIVTTHDSRLRPHVRLVQLADELETARTQLMARGSGFLLYRIIETLVNACFPMLNKLDEKVDQLEEHIFEADVATSVENLSFLRRDIISLRRIIRPNIPVLHSLTARERSFLQLDAEAYFGDLTDGMNRLWDMLEEQKEIIEGLDATLSSLTSHRINRETKAFTLITVIFLPMTLIASILGMNVTLPFADHPLALPIALIIMLVLAGGMLIFFRNRRWI